MRSVNWVARLGHLFSAPVFEGDEDKTRRARLLNGVLWAVASSVLYGLYSLIAGSIGILPVIALILLLTLAGQILMRRGRVRLASLLLSLFLWLLLTIVNVVLDGLDRGTIFGYLLLMVIAGLLVGRRSMALMAALSIAAVLGLSWAQSHSLLPPPLWQDSPWSPVTALILFALLTWGFLYVALKSLDDAVASARQNEAVAKDSNRELQAIRASLERRNEHLRVTVQRYDAYLVEVAAGNLSGSLTLDPDGDGDATEAPLIALGERLNATTASLRAIIGQIYGAARNLSSTAAEILAVTAQQVSGASEQAAAVAQAAATVAGVKVIADRSVERAQEVSGAARRAVDVSLLGQQSVQDSVDAMQRIRCQVQDIAQKIQTLSQQMQQIGQILATVNDLAAQSGMLALNAAIEAARAGEQGKGFAVVAQEVRNLANQSRQATAQVRGILEEIQRAPTVTAASSEAGMEGVDAGAELAGQAGEAIRQLMQVIDESARAAEQMVAAGRQQAAGIDQADLAMHQINLVTAQSLASTRQAERAAQDLNDLAAWLAETVDRYQL